MPPCLFLQGHKMLFLPSTALIYLRHTGHLLSIVTDPLPSPKTLTQPPLSPRWVPVLGYLVVFPYTAKWLWQMRFIFVPNDYLFSVPFSCLSPSILSFMDSIFSYLFHSLPLWLTHYLSSPIYIIEHISAHTSMEHSLTVWDDSEYKEFIVCYSCFWPRRQDVACKIVLSLIFTTVF